MHQLAGRVGRVSEGIVVLLDKKTEKLRKFRDGQTGWDRSELDHSIRGYGTIHSTCQSGMSSFNFAKTLNSKKYIVDRQEIDFLSTVPVTDEILEFFISDITVI